MSRRVDRRIAGKVGVVTGASSGIGEGVARALAGRGARVVLAARRRDRLDEITDAIRGAGGEAHPVTCDVTRVEDLERLVEETRSTFGGCDVLVNNAGVPGGGRFAELSLTQLERITMTNYLGVLRATKLFLPLLVGSRGHLVNVASLAGRFAVPGAAAYTATKHAVVALSESLYHELAPTGVMVTVVNPGFIETEGFPHVELKARRGTSWMVMTPERTVRTILDAIARRRGPEISVPRSIGALQAFRVLVPPLYRAGVRRFTTQRAPSLDADPD